MWPNSRVFRSRWSALFWAAGIIWFAVDVAGTGKASHDPANAAAADADTRDAINAFDAIK